MFPWIRWRRLATRCNLRDTPCVAIRPSPCSPLLDEDVCFNSSLSDGLPNYCAYCKKKIDGARCYQQDRPDEILHFGCLLELKTCLRNETFQIQLDAELRSLKRHLSNQRRRLHKEQWEASRIKSNRRCAPMSTFGESVEEVTTERQAPHLDAVPPTRHTVSMRSLLTTLCSSTRRVFASLFEVAFSGPWQFFGRLLPS